MNPESFQDLYKLVRGSRIANVLLDVQNFVSDNDYQSALNQLKHAHQVYGERYAKTLGSEGDGNCNQLEAKGNSTAKPTSRNTAKQSQNISREERKRLQKKEKVELAMAGFDQLISRLETLAARTRDSKSANADESNLQIETRSGLTPETGNQTLDRSSPSKRTVEGFRTGKVSKDSKDQIGLIDRSHLQFSPVGSLTKSVLDSLQKSTQETGNLDLHTLLEHFQLVSVVSEAGLEPDSIYFLQTQKISLLIKIESKETNLDDQTAVRLKSVLDDRPIKPVAVEKLLQLATQNRLHRLYQAISSEEYKTAKSHFAQREQAHQNSGAISVQIDPSSAESTADDPVEIDQSGLEPKRHMEKSAVEGTGELPKQTQNNVLDLGSFSQLLTSAQRSGLVPNADQIGYIRDKEYRLGHFDKAFQSIDMLHNRFLANAGQRQSRLSREDVDIAAGRIKISPRELQAKRSRDRTQTQEIDRAKRRFQVVLEGLRILMNRQV